MFLVKPVMKIRSGKMLIQRLWTQLAQDHLWIGRKPGTPKFSRIIESQSPPRLEVEDKPVMGGNRLFCQIHQQVAAHAQVKEKGFIPKPKRKEFAAAVNRLNPLPWYCPGKLSDARVSQAAFPQNLPGADDFSQKRRLSTGSQAQVPGNRFYLRQLRHGSFIK
jgi:hypothetical protein